MADGGNYLANIASSVYPDLVNQAKKTEVAGTEAMEATDKAAKEKNALVSEAQKSGGALTVPDIQPYQPPPQSDPWKAFGTPAMWIAAAGGLLTRRSLTASLQAGGEVMQAIKNQDMEKAKQSYEAFKTNADNALKLQDYKTKVFDSILNAKDISADQKLASFRTQLAAFGMDESLGRDIDTAQQHHEAEKKNAADLESAMLDIGEKKAKLQAFLDYGDAVKSKDPAKIAEAKLALAPFIPGSGELKPDQYTAAQAIEVTGSDGKKKTIIGQQDKKTGQWVSADEFRTPIDGVTRALTSAQAAQDIDTDDPSVTSYIKGIANYEIAPPSSSRNPAVREKVLAAVKKENPDYREGDYVNINSVLRAFNTGKQGDTTRSLNVSVKHLEVLKELGEALKNGDTQRINEVNNRLSSEFGDPRANDFNLAKTIVADEVEKAIKSGVGTLAERDELQARFSAANSPEQMSGVIDTAEKLMGGQLLGLEKQYQTATHLNNYREKLFPETVKALRADKSAVSQGRLPKGIPEGSKKVGTYQGHPVYQTSDGKQLVDWDDASQ